MAGKQNKTAETMAENAVAENNNVQKLPEATTDLAEVKKEIAKMMQEAMEAAAEIVKNAKKQAAEITAKPEGVAAPVKAEDGEEEVLIRLPVKKGETDLFVGVNGVGIKIQRGVEVKVKKKYVEAIMNSVAQDEATIQLVDRLTAEYENSKNALN